jgi:hypothetical protein
MGNQEIRGVLELLKDGEAVHRVHNIEITLAQQRVIDEAEIEFTHAVFYPYSIPLEKQQ